MTLRVHRAARADQLVAGLARLLADPLPDPFAQELVLVPARGIERWLSQQLSHRLGSGEAPDDGVCAGVRFRSPRSLVAEVLGLHDQTGAEDDPWAPEALVWPLLEVIDASIDEDWCRPLRLHLGHEHAGEDADLRRGRRYSVARRLAGLFASYARQRPVLLADWEKGDDTDGAGGELPADLAWQPPLWRGLLDRVDAPSPVERHAATVRRLRDDPAAVDLPERFSLFGHTRIPVTELELLGALSGHRDVHLWLPHPSARLWDALTPYRGPVARVDDPSHEAVGHPLLATLGRDLRELERGLLALDEHGTSVQVEHLDEATAARETARPTLLGRLQADLAADAAPPPEGHEVGADGSVQVHACHGRARQVEVLREVLLGLLADDPTLEPRDILVMCPDIEAYAPLITATFGMAAAVDAVPGSTSPAQHPGHQLRVMLADRSLTQTNPLLGVVSRLLDLAGGRAEASAVLDLIATEPVRRRFGFTEDDLETVAGWVRSAGIRWAFDAAHRAEYGLQAYLQNTWRFGLDRILAGVAVSDDADRFFGTTLPLDDVGSTSIDLAGRLAECVDRLQRVTDALVGEHPFAHWLEAITTGVDQLTAVGRDHAWQQAQLHRELRGLAVDDRAAGTALRLSDVRALMAERVAGRPTRANFRTGTLTVCTMTPMRSVPHRVVCLLGLDDGVFPRIGSVDGDDVLARRPLTGERDVRSEDRQLLLDAVVAARETLVVTYTGASETSGLPRPPAVPLQELLDAVDRTAPGVLEEVVHRHPLQAFDSRNLDPKEPFSFDRQALAGARAAVGPRTEVPTIASTATDPLPPRTDDVDLDDLVAFLKNPVKEFLRRRLDIAVPDDGEDALDGIPVELDGLQRWQVGDRMLHDLLEGRTRAETLDREWRRGELPPGRLGWRLAQDLVECAEPLAVMATELRGGRSPRAVDVGIDLGDGRLLTGTVTDLFDERLVKVTFSRLGPKHWIDAWVPLLALSATDQEAPWSAGSIGRGGRGVPTARAAWAAVADPLPVLRDLVALYDAGMRAPLPLPVKTGHCWARYHSAPEQVRIGKARREWKSDRYPGEDAEPAHVLVWGRGADLETLLEAVPQPGEEYDGQDRRLGALACRLWRPMMESVHQ